MATYTIATNPWTENEIRNYYNKAKENFPTNTSWDDLNIIFDTAVKNRELFPGFNGVDTVEEYIKRWVKSFHDANLNPPSKRIAKPKTSCTDPAIRTIVQNTQGLDSDAAIKGELTHNLFMSAENIQGNLLEEYISKNIRKYGFLWCKGNILRAIDFCNSTGTVLLQIKNKSNTENSSSSNIRSGTTIKKWYRLGTKTENGQKVPDYKWESLNTLVNDFKTEGHNLEPCNLSEESYLEFIKAVSKSNTNLINMN